MRAGQQACITGHRQGSKFKPTRCAIPSDVSNSTESNCTD